MRRRLPGGLLFGLALALTLAGCGEAGSSPAERSEITVFAASSLTEPFQELKEQFEADNPGLKVIYNFGGSPALRTQLEQGARADVFASADQAQMDRARQSGLVNGPGSVFFYNRLVVIVPKTNRAGVERLPDLARPGLKFVTAQPDVPVGAYTQQALDKMSKDPTFGPDFAARVAANIVSQESNVKQVVGKVQLGEADAGIVYVSDVTPRLAQEVTRIEIPDRFNVAAAYPINVLKAAPSAAAGQRFVDFVLGPKGQAILKRTAAISTTPGAVTNRAERPAR